MSADKAAGDQPDAGSSPGAGDSIPTLSGTGPAKPDIGRVEALAARYRLAIPERQRAARTGELSGRRTGSSVEYQDRKDFVTGDDLRHVDWRGFARTDRMTVKLYREEITPTIDLVIDTSASMAATPEKAARRTEIAHLFWLLARKLHSALRVHAVGEQVRPMGAALDLLQSSDTRQASPLPLLRGTPATRRGGIKIFISDFLFPFQPRELLRTFPDADRLILVQVLSAFEDNPAEGITAGSMLRLENAEADEHLDVRLDEATVAGYLQRLHALRDDLGQSLRLQGGSFTALREDQSLDDCMRRLVVAEAVTV